MARTAARLYVPLDVSFLDDQKVISAGEQAGWLYIAMLLKAKQVDNDGILTRTQIERLAIRGWQKRLAALVDQGLVVETIADHYAIAGWLNWNESKDSRASRLKAEREAKAARAAQRAAEAANAKQ